MKERFRLLGRKALLAGVVLAAALLVPGPLAVECLADSGFGGMVTPTLPLSSQQPVPPIGYAP